MVESRPGRWRCTLEEPAPRSERIQEILGLAVHTVANACLSGVLTEVSEQGARVMANEMPKHGEPVTLDMVVGDERFTVSGTVCHEGRGDLPNCFGVLFEMPPRSESLR
ncbi:MAG TPA: PilZ domain-containing protein [Phycisphaerae bacterium]|nr:PilZ domain-containing protein [Phycisphaerae bacterium]HNU46490.1 PilZ domain-containing protein [Phycisphaerae bacterium]